MDRETIKYLALGGSLGLALFAVISLLLGGTPASPDLKSELDSGASCYIVDPVAVANAERRLLSRSLELSDEGVPVLKAAPPDFERIGRLIESMMNDLGRDAPVFVKQAVVSSPCIDVTENVLAKMGVRPDEVDDLDLLDQLSEYIPSDLSYLAHRAAKERLQKKGAEILMRLKEEGTEKFIQEQFNVRPPQPDLP